MCFFRRFKIFRTLFCLDVSVCTHTRQVEHMRCSRADRVQKNHNILGKNTISNEHPVYHTNLGFCWPFPLYVYILKVFQYLLYSNIGILIHYFGALVVSLVCKRINIGSVFRINFSNEVTTTTDRIRVRYRRSCLTNCLF